MSALGCLYLIPCTLGDSPIHQSIPNYNIEIINSLDEFIVEDIRTARRFLIKAGIGKPIDSLSFHLLNEHTSSTDVNELLAPLLQGKNAGLLSDAGCPGIADPGSSIVKLAHKKGIRVIPLIGPSSILLALIASGLNGQSFTFHGYLPKQANDRIKKLKQLETEALKEGITQIFIETPYRNDSIIKDIISSCKNETLLSIASDITLQSEKTKTTTIGEWKKEKTQFNDHPAVFLIGGSERK
jgi:16S rRNA (cytidine1402-2'-O)-methyltransferase